MSNPSMGHRKIHRRLIILTCGLVATGPGLLLGVLVVRLWPGPDPAGWPALAVIGVVGGAFTFAAGLVSEPFVSRLAAGMSRERQRRMPVSERRLTVGRLQVYVEPRDLWIGAFIARDAVYVLPLPLLVLRWTRRPAAHCEICGATGVSTRRTTESDPRAPRVACADARACYIRCADQEWEDTRA